MESVPAIEGVSGKQPLTTTQRAQHMAHKGLDLLKGAKAVSRVFSQAVAISEIFKPLSKTLQRLIHVSKIPSITLGLVSIKSAVDDVKAIVDKSKSYIERAKASLLFITHIDSIVTTVATICKIMVAAGAITKKAIQWIPVVNLISFAVGFISLGLDSASVHKSRKLLNKFNEAMNGFKVAKNDEERAEALIQAIQVIEKEGIDPLRKQLMISKKAGKELASRVDALKERIYEPPLPAPKNGNKAGAATRKKAPVITEEDMKLVEILARRATTMLRYKVADLASEVGAIAGGAITIVPVPLAAQITGATILATTGVVSLVSWGGRYFFISKDIFDEHPKNRAMKLLDKASRKLNSLKEQLVTFAIGAKKLPSPAV